MVLGGPEPANYAEEYLNAGADAIVSGEGEVVAGSAAARGRDPAPIWRRVPGIQYRETGGVCRANRACAADSRTWIAQPWPDRERIDIPRYLERLARRGTGEGRFR